MEFKVIIDTDAGSDDAVAIFLALAVQTVHILAFTCTYGNTDESNVETNVRKVLTIANRTDIPIFGGATKPILKLYSPPDHFGRDGLSDVVFDMPLIVDIDKSKTAAQAMVDLVNKNPGEVNILTLGPLTNVALASKLDPSFMQNVKKFYVMGSNITATFKPNPELNFLLDPESNAVLLTSRLKQKILILPWNVVVKNKISKSWRNDVMGKLETEVIKSLNRFESEILKKLDAWFFADSITAAVMIWPNLITEKIDAQMDAILDSSHRGDVRVENDPENKVKNVEIVRNIDVEEFKKILLKYLGNQML